MSRSIWSSIILAAALAACGTTAPGTRPHDMSAAQHEHEATQHESMAQEHQAQYDPDAVTRKESCRNRLGGTGRTDKGGICWTSVTNPTETHMQQANEHRQLAAEHRAASAALRSAEAQACAGIPPEDRDMSPFEHTDDIASVQPLMEPSGPPKARMQRTAGAIITFRAVPGMTAEWLQREVDCHLARNASLGHVMPEMPTCPLVPNGARARVTSTGSGFAVTVRSDDDQAAKEILERAQKLVPAATPASP
jgi:hypothetical protein